MAMKGFSPAQGLIRAFVAVDIGAEARRGLAMDLAPLRQRFPDAKWVSPETVHLTLAFLGDIFPETVPAIAQALDDAAAAEPPFRCVLAGFGYFGTPRSPRVVWAGVTEGSAELMALQRRVAEALLAIGIKGEARAFHPHVTLARIRSPRDAVGLTDRLAEARGRGFGTMAVSDVMLIRSTLQPSGPLYSVLYTAGLKGPGSAPGTMPGPI